MEWKQYRWQCTYIQKALSNNKYANASNKTRLDVLLNEGGLYFDTDVEVIKPFNNLLGNNCFLGFQTNRIYHSSITNAIMGAVRNHWFIWESLCELLEKYDGIEEANYSSPYLTTQILARKGLKEVKEQHIKDVKIYPMEYFSPKEWNSKGSVNLSSKTYCIHHWDGSWKRLSHKSRVINLLRFFNINSL